MTVNERIDPFLRYWSERVDKGEVSPMDRLEVLAIRIFLQWEEERRKIPSSVAVGPVHFIINVDGDPHRIRTACDSNEWTNPNDKLLDPNRPTQCFVTCQACLAAMKKGYSF